MMFVDPGTRAVVANQGDSEGYLSKTGSLYVGQLPENLPIANTALNWGGVKWSLIIWPLPADPFERAR